MNTNKIAILVDSGTDVPKEIIEKYPIYVVPLKVIYKDRVYDDKVDIQPQEVYDRLSEEIPSTSLPDGAFIRKVLDQIKADGYEKVLAITISSGLSGTYNVLRLLAEDYDALEIVVIDTKNVGIGAGIQAIQMATLIEGDFSFEELQQIAKKNVKKTRVFFNVATLEYLQKGGRIGLVSSILGTALKLYPTISCNEDGIYYTVSKTRGRKKSLQKMIKEVVDFADEHQEIRVAVAHGDAFKEALWVKEELAKQLPQVQTILFDVISPALVVHTGPGLLGIAIQIIS